MDCSLEAQYFTEKEVASGDITLNFNEEGDHTFCLIAADELRNWQTTAQVIPDNIPYDTGPPQLLDISSTNQNRMHNAGEEIHILVYFDKEVYVNPTNPGVDDYIKLISSKEQFDLAKCCIFSW